MPKAAVDIGSNTILLTVVDDNGSLLHDQATLVGLASGLGDRGLFQTHRMQHAERVLASYAQVALTHGVQPWSIQAAATSGARRAMNAETWFAKVKRDLGLRVRIISGAEEARLTWIGAHWGLPAPVAAEAVVDVGGGSTEISVGDKLRLEWTGSLPLGSVRLTESWLSTQIVRPEDIARLHTAVETSLRGARLPRLPGHLIAVAGTATTLCAMKLGLQQWSTGAIHGALLTRADLSALIRQLGEASPTQRREMVPTDPGRADYLLAGAVVLNKVLDRSTADAFTVSVGGMRFGLLETP